MYRLIYSLNFQVGLYSLYSLLSNRVHSNPMPILADKEHPCRLPVTASPAPVHQQMAHISQFQSRCELDTVLFMYHGTPPPVWHGALNPERQS